MIWQFATAGRVVFGRGSIEQLGTFLPRLNIKRPVIVTDETLTQLGVPERLRDMHSMQGFATAIYSGCKPEPPVACVINGVELARQHQCDGLIALGGGSNMDVAKMMAVILKHGGQPSDYFGFDRVPGPVLPLIACPTTAGTGSEVSHSSVLSDLDAGIKVSSLSHFLRPAVALVDPACTDTCPPTPTAHSGIDALVHAIEAITARHFTLMPASDVVHRAYEGAFELTQMLGLEAVRLIGRSLVRAFRDGSDQDARDDMALAALLAGMAFSNSGVAVVHALEYPIGVLTHCSHGEGNGLLLPHVMRFNLDSRPKEFARIASALQSSVTDQTIRGEGELRAAQDAVDLVVQLQHDLKIRTRLRDLGLSQEQLPGIAAKSIAIKRLMDTNPRLPTESDLLSILQSAF